MTRTYRLVVNGKQVSATVRRIDQHGVAFCVGDSDTVHEVQVLSPEYERSSGGNSTVATQPSLIPAASTNSDSSTSLESDTVVSPMPGFVVSVAVQAGQEVAAGETLLVIEAMKMENNVPAPKSGTIAEILVKAGDEVGSDTTLVRYE